MADPEETIVAEVSQNYTHGVGHELLGHPLGLAPRFENAIKHNAARGYRLRDWHLSRVTSDAGGVLTLNETIIAVFEKRTVRRGE